MAWKASWEALGLLEWGYKTAGMGLQVGLMYKQVNMASKVAESNKSAEKGRQERWHFNAFLHILVNIPR